MAELTLTLERLEELLDSICEVRCCPTHDAHIEELMSYREKIVELWSADMCRQHDDGESS